MSKLLPIIGGISGTAIIGGAGAYLISTQKAPKFEEKFKNALIKFDGIEDDLLKEKLKTLKAKTVNSDIAKLTEAKGKVNGESGGLAELKEACREIYQKSFDKKDSNIFKDFQSYCSKNIKDKIGSDQWYKENTPKWGDRFDKLDKAGTKPFSDSLKKIASEAKDDGNKLKKWCDDIASEVFEDDNHLEFKDAKVYCGTKD